MTAKKNKSKHKTYGIVSLITGVLSLLLVLMPYFGLPLAILAVWFSSKSKKLEDCQGLATGGNVTGIIGIVLNGICIMFVGLALIFFGSFL